MAVLNKAETQLLSDASAMMKYILSKGFSPSRVPDSPYEKSVMEKMRQLSLDLATLRMKKGYYSS